MRIVPWRVVMLAAVVFAGGRVAARSATPVPLRTSLDSFPLAVDGWRGADAPPFDDETRAVLGVDDYLNRVYQSADGSVASLYVGYYQSQQQGDAIHSPRNCLPGNGWQPLEQSRAVLPLDRADAVVNRYVVGRDDARQLVIYWFEGRGRIVASEYWNKWFMLADGWRHGRSEGALVRLIAPLSRDNAGPSDEAVTASLLRLGRGMHEELARWLP